MSKVWSVMSRSAVLVLGAIVSLGRAGCGGPSSPTPVASASPAPSPSSSPGSGLPNVRPSSTAFENLALIRSLEVATGRQSILYFVSAAGLTQDGFVTPTSSWDYSFYAPATSTVIGYNWLVRGNGRVEFRESSLVIRGIDFTEIQPRLRVDSPQAVRLALEYGARAYANRYPEALVQMTYRYIARQPICQMTLFVLGTNRPACELGPIMIHAETGELMLRDLSCYDLLQ